MNEYEKVSVNIKVLNVLDPITVPTGKNIQEVIIPDSSTSSKCTLWDDDIGSRILVTAVIYFWRCCQLLY